jgi:hypothetical protein
MCLICTLMTKGDSFEKIVGIACNSGRPSVESGYRKTMCLAKFGSLEKVSVYYVEEKLRCRCFPYACR